MNRTVTVEKTTGRSLTLIPLVIVSALFIYKANASIRVLGATWSSGSLAGKPGVVAFGQQVSSIGALERSANYFLVIWPALVFGVLIAAGVRAFVPIEWISRLLGARSVKTQLTAGLAGAPLMLCSCCVAPVFASVAETSARIGPALGLMLASPSLNPAALALTFLLFEPRVAAARLLLAVGAVVWIGPLAERLVPHARIVASGSNGFDNGSSHQNAATQFLKSLGAVAWRTIPGVVLGVFVSMLIVQFLPVGVFASPGARITAILVAATIAVPLALPTFLEIPLSIGLLAAGFPVGAAVALLFAGPAINLPSLWSVARIGGWKVAGTVAVSVWVLAILGGLAVG